MLLIVHLTYWDGINILTTSIKKSGVPKYPSRLVHASIYFRRPDAQIWAGQLYKKRLIAVILGTVATKLYDPLWSTGLFCWLDLFVAIYRDTDAYTGHLVPNFVNVGVVKFAPLFTYAFQLTLLTCCFSRTHTLKSLQLYYSFLQNTRRSANLWVTRKRDNRLTAIINIICITKTGIFNLKKIIILCIMWSSEANKNNFTVRSEHLILEYIF